MSDVTFELPADDLERVSKFYSEVFGWSTMALPFDSVVIETSGKTVDPHNCSGVFSKRAEFVKAPILIINVDDIEEAMKRVEGAGGRILNAKAQVGDFGYSVYAEDTEGTTFCLWQPIPEAS